MSTHYVEPGQGTDFAKMIQQLDIPAELASSVKALYDGRAALRPALSAIDVAVSPQLARSMQATENAWRSIEAEFGLLTASSVGLLLTGREARDTAHRMRGRGELMAVRRGNAFLYPGFQFTQTGQVRPWVAPLKKLADGAEWPDGDALLWMGNPSGRLGGRRPVDFIDDPVAVLEAARLHIGDAW